MKMGGKLLKNEYPINSNGVLDFFELENDFSCHTHAGTVPLILTFVFTFSLT